MPSITITLTVEAHSRLKARKATGESFSDVIMREVPPAPAGNAGELLERLKEFEGKDLVDEERMKIVLAGRGRRSKRDNATR